MTSNQLQYWANKEIARSNLAKEAETQRSNLAKEAETKRHNFEDEAVKRIGALNNPFSIISSFATGDQSAADGLENIWGNVYGIGENLGNKLSNVWNGIKSIFSDDGPEIAIGSPGGRG